MALFLVSSWRDAWNSLVAYPKVQGKASGYFLSNWERRGIRSELS